MSEDKELTISMMNQARRWLPHLLALSSNSPFWAGRYTGLKSYRAIVWGGSPRNSLPLACPHALNIERQKKDQMMTFGHGIHYCLGGTLARMELQVIFPTLFQRLPGLRLAFSDVRWRPNFLLRGLIELPLEFDQLEVALDEIESNVA